MEFGLQSVLDSLWAALDLFHRMSPYLLFGFLFAGILHVFVPLESVAKHLGGKSMASVFKAALFGIPLPLCSCAVVPATLTIQKKGAGPGAVLSFLISTPITGVDSILATLALLGPVFTLFRIVAAALAAVIAGILANFWVSELPAATASATACAHCPPEKNHQSEITERDPIKRGRVREMLHYAFDELLGEIFRPLLIGILIGGMITTFIPASLVERFLGDSFTSMLFMALLGIPMYVCATGSIPIAAAFMLKGMSPGAALVFLLAGPATNSATIAVVWRRLGQRATYIYLAAIALVSLAMGALLNLGWPDLRATLDDHPHQHGDLTHWLQIGCTVALAALLLRAFWRSIKKPLVKKPTASSH